MTWARSHSKTATPTTTSQKDLIDSYRAVFQGHPSNAQQQMVLADLAASSGWNQITIPDGSASDAGLWFREGQRSVFGRLFSMLSYSVADLESFENAVRHEAAFMSKFSDA